MSRKEGEEAQMKSRLFGERVPMLLWPISFVLAILLGIFHALMFIFVAFPIRAYRSLVNRFSA